MYNVEESKIIAAAVPAKTETYSPVAHADIINAIMEQADKRGLEVKSKQYWSNREDQRITGKFNIVVPGDNELGVMVAFRNSYDRTMSLGFAAGGNVWICTNGQVGGDITLVRRHTGSIVKEVTEKIELSMNQLEEEHKKLTRQNQIMKNVEMSRTEMAKLAGQLFIEHELVNSTQLNVIKNEILGSDNFKDENLWCMYNHVTEAYKKSSAYSYLDNHRELHKFVETKYELV